MEPNTNSSNLISKFLENKCVFCLNQLGKSKTTITPRITQLFSDLTQIQLIPEDLKEHWICRECNKNLKISWTFKNKLIEKHNKLLEILRQEKDVKLECPDLNIEERSEPAVQTLTAKKSTEFRNKQKNDTAVCPGCLKLFRRDSLKIHFDRIHRKLKRYSCDLCKYQSYLKTHIRNHIISIHTSQRNFQCSICSIHLPSPSALASHKLFKHTQAKNHNCQECSKKFKRKRLLADHVRIVHRKERPFLCDFRNCTQAFSKKILLENHRKKHFEEPSFACEICGKLYHTVYNLQKHSVIHKDPEFACKICPNKRFYKKYNWQIHMKTHSGTRDFKCQLCSQSYFKKDHLNRHIQNAHSKLKLKCEIPGCNSEFSRKDTIRKHLLSHHKNVDENQLKILLGKIKSIKVELDSSTFQIKNSLK